MDEHLYHCLKQMENAAQGTLFALPFGDSPAHKALAEKSEADMWKLRALTEYLIWFRDRAKDAATTAYMQGKE